MLLGLGWLDPGTEKRWRQGQIDYLERGDRRISTRYQFRQWADGKGQLNIARHFARRVGVEQACEGRGMSGLLASVRRAWESRVASCAFLLLALKKLIVVGPLGAAGAMVWNGRRPCVKFGWSAPAQRRPIESLTA